MVEIFKVKLPKEHHDDLQEAVPKVAEDLRVWQEYVEGKGKRKQSHRVGGKEFKDGPGNLQWTMLLTKYFPFTVQEHDSDNLFVL